MDLLFLPSSFVNTTFALAYPAMQFLTSALLLGSVAVQSVAGRPSLAQGNDLSDFVGWETNIALQKLLCNIGPDGCEAKKAKAGVVIASPSTEDPNCKRSSGECVLELICLTCAFRLLHMDARQCSRFQEPRRQIHTRVGRQPAKID